MAKIKNIYAREILDSKGNPTIETTVVLSDGAIARSSCPSGSSKSTYEAFDLRDGDKNRYWGMGVLQAVKNVNEIIAKSLVGVDAFAQQEIDRIMIDLDGTQNKSKLGGNSILSVSQAVAKAASRSSLLPLSVYLREFLSNKNIEKKMPTLIFNLLEGGKHSPQGIDFQEILLIPATSKNLSDSLLLGATVYKKLRSILSEKTYSTLNADEGGFSPSITTNREAFTLLKSAIEQSGYAFARDAFMGADFAAQSFLDGKSYRIKDRDNAASHDEMVEFYESLFSEFSLMYMEDPFAQDDWEGWKKIFEKLGKKSNICGDDIVSTNPYRLQLAIDNNILNSIIVKPNQIGTVTQALAVCEIARFKNLKIIVSHRSNETTDDFIADFAVAVGADYVKFGAPARERIAKYNRLSEIEKEIASL